MKKTFLAIALVLSMMFSLVALTSCGSPLDGDDALEAIRFIDEKMNEVKGFDAKVTVTEAGMGVEMTMKADISDAENPKMIMTMQQSIPGLGSADINVTLVDSVMYSKTTIAGQSIKQKVTDPDMIKEMTGEMDSINENYTYASAEFVSRENDVYVVKAVIAADSFDKLIGDIEGATDVTGTLTYVCDADGVVSKMTIETTYKLAGEEVKSTMEIEFTSLEAPTITVPSDASEYTEAE